MFTPNSAATSAETRKSFKTAVDATRDSVLAMRLARAQELLMHDALADRSRVVYDPYTPEQQQGIRRQLEKFVAAQVKKTLSVLKFWN